MKDIKFSELANFQPKQLEAEALLKSDECKYLLYGGAGGGGKSYFLRWSALRLALYYSAKYGPGIPVGLFSEDYPTLKDRQIAKIKREFPDWLGELKATQEEGLAYYIKPEYGGGIILLRNLDDPSKYASVEFAAILVEELTKNPESTFEDLRFRLRYPGIDEVKFVGATNPGQIGHGWVKRKFVLGDDSDPEYKRFFFVPAKATDNKYIGSDYMKQLDALPPAKRAALRDGSWDVFEGQFFDMWREDVHVTEPLFDLKDIPDNYEMRLTWDDGTTAPRSVHLMIQNNDGRVFVVWEYYKAGETADEAAQNIKTALQDLKIYDKVVKRAKLIYDPSMDIRNNQTGVPTSTVVQNILGNITKVKGNNDRIEGARRYRSYLNWTPFEEPLLQIWSTCRNLIRTLPELIYDDNNPEDVNSDGEDHAYDDTRYGLMSFTKLPTRLGSNQVEKVKKYEKIVKNAYKPKGGVL